VGRLVIPGTAADPGAGGRRGGRRQDRDVIPRRGAVDPAEPSVPPAVALGPAAFVALYLHYVLVMGGN
jgi:hypothetical protein